MLCRCNVLYYLGTYISQSISTRLKALVYAERYGRHETMSWSWTDSYHSIVRTASHVNVIDSASGACMHAAQHDFSPAHFAWYTHNANQAWGSNLVLSVFHVLHTQAQGTIHFEGQAWGRAAPIGRRSRGRSISTWVDANITWIEYSLVPILYQRTWTGGSIIK